MQYTIDIDVPEGWKPVAFREVREGETYINSTGGLWENATGTIHGPRIILERIEPETVMAPVRTEWLKSVAQTNVGGFVVAQDAARAALEKAGVKWE